MFDSGDTILTEMVNFIKDLMTYQWTWGSYTFTLWHVAVLAIVLDLVRRVLDSVEPD